MALVYAKQLLAREECPAPKRLMSLSFAFEALCMMDRPQDCFTLLPANEMQQLLSESMDNKETASRDALLLNLAVVYLCRNQSQRAQECLNRLQQQQQQNAPPDKKQSPRSDSQRSMRALLLQMYLDLLRGDKTAVLRQLEKNHLLMASDLTIIT